MERGRRLVGHAGQPDAPVAPDAGPLDGDHDDGLGEGLLARDPVLDAADEGLVHFDGARERLAVGHDHRPAELVEPSPGGLVLHAHRARDFQRCDALLAVGDPPGHAEPLAQRLSGPLEDGSGGWAGVLPALAAGVGSALGQPAGRAAAGSRANEAAGPPQPHEVVQARRLIREEAVELRLRPWVVSPCDGPCAHTLDDVLLERTTQVSEAIASRLGFLLERAGVPGPRRCCRSGVAPATSPSRRSIRQKVPSTLDGA